MFEGSREGSLGVVHRGPWMDSYRSCYEPSCYVRIRWVGATRSSWSVCRRWRCVNTFQSPGWLALSVRLSAGGRQWMCSGWCRASDKVPSWTSIRTGVLGQIWLLEAFHGVHRHGQVVRGPILQPIVRRCRQREWWLWKSGRQSWGVCHGHSSQGGQWLCPRKCGSMGQLGLHSGGAALLWLACCSSFVGMFRIPWRTLRCPFWVLATSIPWVLVPSSFWYRGVLLGCGRGSSQWSHLVVPSCGVHRSVCHSGEVLPSGWSLIGDWGTWRCLRPMIPLVRSLLRFDGGLRLQLAWRGHRSAQVGGRWCHRCLCVPGCDPVIGKQVSFYILGTRLVMECEVVFCELSDPVGLSSVQLLGESEILEVLMICPDFYVFSCAHEVMAPFGERKHDCEPLFVVDLVISFCCTERFRHESHWAPGSILVLTKHCSDRSFAGISLDSEGVGFSQDGEDDILSHSTFQLLEGFVLHFCPFPFCIAHQLHEGANDFWVHLDELLIEVREAQEWLEFLFSSGSWPFSNTGDLDGIHADRVLTDDDAEILCFEYFELALLCFEEELVFFKALEHTLHDSSMFVQIFWKDEDVVEVNGDLPFSD